MQIEQFEIILKPRSRGFHLITDEIESQLPFIKKGIAHIFLKHTSASLSLNENADFSVRVDAENFFNHLVPDGNSLFTHTLEGADDMPAHIKNMILGSSLTLPISEGRFNLGTWQGIYLCEHRNYGGSRKVVITIIGE